MRIRELTDIFRKWLHMPDTKPLEIILATFIGEELAGDPLWLHVVGPPSSAKTEMLRIFRGQENAEFVDSLTPGTFVSGRPGSNNFLGELNRKILIIKDLTVLLRKPRHQRDEIFGQLRAIYDGDYTALFGSGVTPGSFQIRFGILTGVTSVIDDYDTVNSVLGERFLKVRLYYSYEDSAIATSKAENISGQEDNMRAELRDNVTSFLQNIQIPAFNELHLTQEMSRKLQKVARFLSIARTYISHDHRRLIFNVPEPELPTRLIKQLKKLLIGLQVIKEKEEAGNEEYQTVKRVVLDSIPPTRKRILQLLAQGPKIQGNIVEETKMRYKTVETTLQDLWELGLVHRQILEDRQGQPKQFSLVEEWSDMFVGGGVHDEVQQPLSSCVTPPPTNPEAGEDG